MPYSTACNTPLSGFESGPDCKDVQGPAVVGALPGVGDPDGASAVAWTITPRTPPSDRALCGRPAAGAEPRGRGGGPPRRALGARARPGAAAASTGARTWAPPALPLRGRPMPAARGRGRGVGRPRLPRSGHLSGGPPSTILI